MAFINKTDLTASIRLYRIDQITDNDDSVITAAITTAESTLINLLSGPGYNITAELAKIGSSRNALLVDWCKYITLYKIYDRIPDAMVPDRIIKNYDDTMKMLNQASQGVLSLTLERIPDADGKPNTKFRFGGDKRRR